MPQISRRAVMAAPVLLAVPAAIPEAQAHAILRRSEPAAGATVPPGPLRIRIFFNSRIDHERSQILVAPARRGGGGTADEVRVELEPGMPVTEMAGTTQPLTPGAWRFRWQVLALDGHITRGDVFFTVAG